MIAIRMGRWKYFNVFWRVYTFANCQWKIQKSWIVIMFSSRNWVNKRSSSHYFGTERNGKAPLARAGLTTYNTYMVSITYHSSSRAYGLVGYGTEHIGCIFGDTNSKLCLALNIFLRSLSHILVSSLSRFSTSLQYCIHFFTIHIDFLQCLILLTPDFVVGEY